MIEISQELKRETIHMTTYKGVVTSISTHGLTPSEMGEIAFQTASFGERVRFEMKELIMDDGSRVSFIKFRVANVEVTFYSQHYFKEGQ
jgi:hypothetical protein